ncbi:MAG: WG repeat-containing protein [Acetatifactor sp.]|nr:WG repeat-containing protein [Acetatifactor sp.]
MARRKNIVSKTRGTAALLSVGMLAAGWLLAAHAVTADDAAAAQNALIEEAEQYLADRLYVRAAALYEAAVNGYHTENNLFYEGELLGIYRQAGMLEQYYGLIEERMEAGRAAPEEYLEYAGRYLEEGMVYRALPVLKQAVEQHDDQRLSDLYESARCRYSVVNTVFSQAAIPSGDWYIPVYDGTYWGYIGADGRTVLNFIYEEATCFSGDYAVVRLEGVYTLIDKSGYWNAVDKNALDEVTAICGERIVGVKDGRYAIYSNTFQPLQEETYEEVYLSENGLSVVRKDGRWAILDQNLQQVTDYRYTDMAVNSRGRVFEQNYAVAADETGYFLIDRKGEPCFEKRFPDAKGLEEGVFAVADDSGRWGFADEKGELVLEYRFEDAFSFSDSLAPVKSGGSWGYVNRDGDMVIEAQFEAAYPFLEGKSLAVDDLGYYRILSLKYYDLF